MYQEGNTCLHHAASGGHEALVVLLLERTLADHKLQLAGARFWSPAERELYAQVLNAKNKEGLTPLHLAAQHSHDRIVRTLVLTFRALVDSHSLVSLSL